MQHNHNTLHISDDEDDLESLRLAALQSLKRPASSTTSEVICGSQSRPTVKKFTNLKNPNKRIRGFFGNTRPPRNGSYNRIRNTNLISVQTLETEPVTSTSSKQTKNLSDSATIPKLILPQDRYCNKLDTSDDKSNEATSKFDRYNDSANSDSDSEDEPASSGDSPKKLQRSSSLEALMKELENELQGEKKIESKPKIKVKKIDESIEEPVTKSPVKESVSIEVDVRQKTPPITNENIPLHNSHVAYPIQQIPVGYIEPVMSVNQPMPYTNINSNMNIPFDPYRFSNIRPFEVLPNNPTRYERPLSPITIKTDILNTISAPLSPRSAAFVLQNREIIERRKKSPRRSYSRSPRPEFRRNLSPRYLSKSPSPVRNRRVSPVRNIRRSPNVRRSPNTLRSKDRVSPVRSRRSPQRNNIRERLGASQVDVNTERKRCRKSRSISLSLSPSPVRDTGSPTNDFDENQDSSSLDPVLEARKKKFEANGSAITEGIIRLKPKEDEEEDTCIQSTGDEVTVEDGNEDELIIEDSYVEFDQKVDLFSDEESDDENEGRFKLNSEQKSRDITILPFTQLLNGTSKTVQSDSILCDTKKPYRRDRDQRERNRSSRTDYKSDRNRLMRSRRVHDDFKEEKNRKSERQQSRSPPFVEKVHEKIIELPKDNSGSQIFRKIDLKTIKSTTGDVLIKVEQKKLPTEIKIRNPKYEIVDEKSHEVMKDKNKSSSRKVKVAKDSVEEETAHFVETQAVVVDNEEDEDDDMFNTNDAAGDLRTQLSRKRAERQSKLPKVEEMPSRLLKSALQGAVFKKSKKSKKSKDERAPLDNLENSVSADVKQNCGGTGTNNYYKKDRKVRIMHYVAESLSAVTDGKLPIHLRLGIPGSPDAFNDSKGHKISRKRIKNRGILEQV